MVLKSTSEFLPKCWFYILSNCNNKVCEIFSPFFYPFWLVLSPWKGNQKSAPIEKSPNHQGLGSHYFYDFWILGILSPLLLCNTWSNTSTAKFYPFAISQLFQWNFPKHRVGKTGVANQVYPLDAPRTDTSMGCIEVRPWFLRILIFVN